MSAPGMVAPRRRRVRSWRMPLLATALLAVLAGAAACGETDATAGSPDQQAGAVSAGAGGLSVTATNADGAQVRLPAGKPAVVYFFAPSCYSCIAGTRAVADARQHAPEAADYVAVNLDPRSKCRGRARVPRRR
jgi:cytochrome oxidase Cu insertion factor (SCO1/SenC/PrrC family)